MDDEPFEWYFPVYTLVDVALYHRGLGASARLYAAYGSREPGLTLFTDTHLATRFIADGMIVDTAVVAIPDRLTLLIAIKPIIERGAAHAVFDPTVHSAGRRDLNRVIDMYQLITDLEPPA